MVLSCGARGFLLSGVRGLYVGGNYNSNDNYGFFYFNANNNPSNTNTNLSSRLHCLKYLTICRKIRAPWQKFHQGKAA